MKDIIFKNFEEAGQTVLKFLSQKMDPGQIYISNTAAFGGMLNLHRYESLNNLNTKHKCGELIATVW